MNSVPNKKKRLADYLLAHGAKAAHVQLTMKLVRPFFGAVDSSMILMCRADDDLRRRAQIVISLVGMLRTMTISELARSDDLVGLLNLLDRNPALLEKLDRPGWKRDHEPEQVEIEFLKIRQLAATESSETAQRLDGEAIWRSLEKDFYNDFVYSRFSSRFRDLFPSKDARDAFETEFAECLGNDLGAIIGQTLSQYNGSQYLNETIRRNVVNTIKYFIAFCLTGQMMEMIQLGLALWFKSRGTYILGKKQDKESNANRWLVLVRE